MRIRFFRIFYSTTFTVLGLILAVLLLTTPGDHVYQAFKNDQIYNIFIIAGVYLLTFIVTVLLYASRLYTNRRNLVHIPKAWSPLEKGHVERRVRKLVEEQLIKSAIIAYESRPRDTSQDEISAATETAVQFSNAQVTRPSSAPRDESTATAQKTPPWGTISHPGWSSPSSPDLPNLHYEPVIHELSNLIEAKAVSLAPPDPLYDPTSTAPEDAEPPLPDALVVELLQRPAAMGLRDYFAHLKSLGIIDPDTEPGPPFLALYEKARFSDTPLSEPDFRTLMAMFADILRGMRPLDPDLIAQIHADNDALSLENESLYAGVMAHDNDDDGASQKSNATVQHTPQPDRFFTPRPDRYSLSSGSEAGSEGTVRTAPSRQVSQRRAMERASVSFRSKKLQQQQRLGTPSSMSLRRVESSSAASRRSGGSSGSGGSVIRLKEARTPLDLPYMIVTGSREVL